MNSSKKIESLMPPLWILTLLGCAVSLWILYQLKEIMVLLVVGYSIAYVIDPALDYLERKKISRTWGVGIIFAGFALVIAVLALTAVPTIARQYTTLSTNLPDYITTGKEKLLPLLERAKSYFPGEGGTPLDHLPPITGETLNKIFGGVLTALLGGYSITLTLLNLLLLPFIAFYIAVDFSPLHAEALLLFPASYRKKVRDLCQEMNHYVSAFVRGQITVCSILFLLYAAGLSLLGVQLWFLLAVIAGFGNMIPYLGFLSGIILSSIMALATFGDLSHMVKVWILFAIVQALEGFLITPQVIGEKVGISPLGIILAIFTGGQLFGLLGIFLAVPGAAIVKVIANHFHAWVLQRA